ncbi:MAG: hypothetical protein Gaeavirus15_2 [Gaeavirus sp.]|uniref:Uncharacterized protein n=1 Tax=Gaeavirus sp. TaxID=2487767 RepID=A0A3G4ZZ80_9VIRU|nr:MAG: hypothetical protein Gaeavirus15_2 [Gaeavirus sp.]
MKSIRKNNSTVSEIMTDLAKLDIKLVEEPNPLTNNDLSTIIAPTDTITTSTTTETEEQPDPVKTSNDFLKELLVNQLKTINPTKKLNYNDIKRISKFLVSSIFDPTECSIWNGYVTNEKNQSKGTYINFYFNQKKIALHRLLYLNFLGDILNTEYIKFSCSNKGKCCNIHHMKKYSYNSNIVPPSTANHAHTHNTDNNVRIYCDKDDLILEI